MLRIGIDGRAFASPAAGIRRYVTGLTRALLALGEPLEIVALGGRDSSALPPASDTSPNRRIPQPILAGRWSALPRAAGARGVDVIHAPAYTAPFWSPRARRAHHSRRQLRAAPAVVSVPA